MLKRRRFDRKLTATMVEDFRRDPILASKIIFNWEIPPHQQIRLIEMWTRKLTIDDSGFSTGKTATLALVLALRSILFTERISGIVSGTFRQSKLIFGYLDKWYRTSPIFRFCVMHHRGLPRLTHGTEVWEGHFTNGSQVRALPPGFTNDSSRMRSERWHDGYFDEWTTFDVETLTKTLFGRATAINRYQGTEYIVQNHIHLSSTPGFKGQPSYELVKSVSREIDDGMDNYSRFTSNWRHVPKRKKWAGFVDYKTIHIMQKTNPPGIVGCEIEGIWQDSSLSFYLSTEIDEARGGLVPILAKRYRERDIYLGGFDSARGGTTEDIQTSGKGDDFAFSVLRLTNSSDKPQHVATIRKNNIKARQMADIVRNLDEKFLFKYITYDPGGGGAFVVDELKEPQDSLGNRQVSITHLDDFQTPNARRILIPFKRGNRNIDIAFELQGARSDSVLVNKLHNKVNGLISELDIFLAPQWNKWPIMYGVAEVNNMRKWLNINGHTMKELDYIAAEADLAVCQLVSVDIDRDRSGMPKIDTYGMYKFKSRYKKDSAYSLIYSMGSYFVLKAIEKKNKRGKGKKIVFSTTEY